MVWRRQDSERFYAEHAGVEYVLWTLQVFGPDFHLHTLHLTKLTKWILSTFCGCTINLIVYRIQNQFTAPDHYVINCKLIHINIVSTVSCILGDVQSHLSWTSYNKTDWNPLLSEHLQSANCPLILKYIF